jgi:hypothetical protein
MRKININLNNKITDNGLILKIKAKLKLIEKLTMIIINRLVKNEHQIYKT